MFWACHISIYRLVSTKKVTHMLTQWSYVFLVLTHRPARTRILFCLRVHNVCAIYSDWLLSWCLFRWAFEVYLASHHTEYWHSEEMKENDTTACRNDILEEDQQDLGRWYCNLLILIIQKQIKGSRIVLFGWQWVSSWLNRLPTAYENKSTDNSDFMIPGKHPQYILHWFLKYNSGQ